MRSETEISERKKEDIRHLQQIIYPFLRDTLNEQYSNINEIEEEITEELTLDTGSKLKPIDEDTLNKFKKLEKKKVEEHSCFCGFDDKKDNVIHTPCCKKKFITIVLRNG